MKRKVSLLLAVIIAMTTILPIMIVNAAGELMTLTAKRNGTTLASGTIIDVKTTDTDRKITVSVDVASTTNLVIYYCWDKTELKTASTGSKTATITIPNFKAGTRHILQLEAVINDHANNLVGNSNIVTLGINVPEEEATVISTTLKNGSSTIKPGSTVEVDVNTTLKLTATSNKKVQAVAYKWDDRDMVQLAGSSANIVVPAYEAGSTHKLQVRAVAEDATLSDLVSYMIKIPEAEVPTEITASVKNGNTTLKNGATLELKAGTILKLIGTSNKTVKTVAYKWDNENYVQANAAAITITVPNYAAGSTHKLQARAAAEDGTLSELLVFTIKIPAEVIVEPETEITASVKNGNTTLKNGATVELEAGKSLKLTGTSNKTVKAVAYKWDNENFVEVKGSSVNIVIPNYAAGSTHKLQARAAAEDGTLSELLTFTVKIPAEVIVEPETEITASVKNGNTTLKNGSTVELKAGITLKLIGTSNKTVKAVAYKWDNENFVQVNAAATTITIPNFAAGSTHKLQARAVAEDGTLSELLIFTIKIPAEVIVEPETEIKVNLKQGGAVLSTSKDVYVLIDEELTAYATCNIEVEKLVYSWDDEASVTINDERTIIEIPEDFEVGSEHTLTIQAIAKDGTKSTKKEYTIIIDEIEDEDDELIIEAWMEENDDLDGLAVSLRNDSEEDKANKNIYELNEEITYYVDYKNGGKDTTKKVTLVLNVPETFKVVSADGGSVSTSKGTITWTFNGLDEDESGTKTVVLKYTKIGASKVTYKIVKPFAEIKLDSKVKDTSAVINMIYKDKDTEIKELHVPYMFGDKDRPTFRPDDTITRAEGALVLTRIFGISTAYDKSTYSYPDLDETYLEARKAIVAATEYGIINGYEDGTYKPNKAMTRAEFLKIIANRVAIENGDGFEIKDLESSIKVYDDPTRVYIMGNNYLTNHWALEEVTLLARLNMTSVSEKEKNLRLDEPITRAEVAQLVNFYLLRAPADVTSKTKTEFSDVNKNHKLFADIVEATRDAHTYYITDETTEEAEF